MAEEFAPSLADLSNFDADADAQALRGAMKGLGADEKVIIDVLCARSYQQVKEIERVYQQTFGRVLVDDLKSETSGKFEKVLLTLFKSPVQYDAYVLHHAIKGLGTDETAIIEIMCTRTNKEIEEIKAEYKKAHKKDLASDLQGDTSGDFKRILVSLTSGSREDECEPDMGLAAKDAGELKTAGEGQAGTDEEKFNMIFARRSFRQLGATFAQYRANYNKDIVDIVDSEFSGCIKEALTAIAKTAAHGRPYYFAEQLHDSMKGAGTSDDQLIRLVASRSRVDMLAVKRQFAIKYKKALEQWIIEDTSGDYKDALVALTAGNQ